ncbi:MAG: EAL domain-containing protein [Colwellia sp.]|nr:EAL domain-containing protein [Colwellia sp.]
MANKKMNKILKNRNLDERKKEGFFKRFSMALEGSLIICVTVGLLCSARFFNLSELLQQKVSNPQSLPLIEVITMVSISVFALVTFLARYSVYLRKKMKQQFIAEEDIKRLAFFDSLTNLPNQDLCHDRLKHGIARAAGDNSKVSILFISIGDFKSINDKYGHEGGDKLLQQVAKRLSSELRSGDTLARVAGVEFLVILESLTDEDNINSIAEKILAKLVKCYRISMQEAYITSNIGISIYPSDGEHSKELIKNADTAMRFAKEQGRNSLAFFSKNLQKQINTKKKIADQLREAMENETFFLHYQPIVSAGTNSIIAVEALLRWHNELLGEVAPDVFIPIAEEIGIINQICDWVLVRACLQNKAWQEQGYDNIVMSINLSSMQLTHRDYANTISAALAESQLEPQYLELEFTEKALMKDAKQSVVQLRKLSALGVSLALDDFGTGYSSMKYLPKFKLNKLKIDRRFIKKVPESRVDVMTTRAIVALAGQLKLQVTAEGVETARQCEFIENCQIEAMQGYHFSRPVDSKAFTQLLHTPTW